MNLTPEEREKLEQFEVTYSQVNDPVRLEAERRALGSDYGANSFTTADQARELIGRLELGPASLLLDLGTGAGYPGLLMAEECRCSVVLADMPLAGLKVAKVRAGTDRVRAHVVQASGTALPFAGDLFDAVHHSDTLCWLQDKLSVLRACHRALRSGGRLGFYVIAIADGLSGEDYERAVDAGPVLVETEAPYGELVTAAGFTEVTDTDVTESFRETCTAWLTAFDHLEDALQALMGSEEFEEKQADRRTMVAAIDDGLLERRLFLARK